MIASLLEWVFYALGLILLSFALSYLIEEGL